MLADVAAMSSDRWGVRSLRPMTDEEFRLWQAIIEARTGMTVGETRRPFLETSIGMRMRELGIADYDTYYERLLSGLSSEPEWAILVNRLTVQETSFLRHPSSFALLRQHVDALLRSRPERKSLNVWSVGCASGEEPYSLAMQLDEQLRELHRDDVFFGVTASDISLPTLSKARQGRYGERRLLPISDAWRERYFRQVSKTEWEVQSAIRDRVCFVQINVMNLENAPLFDMDVIFCQNVLIYFRRFRKRDIVNKLVDRLAPGGLLILGVNELVDWRHPGLERVAFPDTLAFRRLVD